MGVERGQLVAFYLTNSPEFMIALLGTWAIGTAPAMVNYNLGGKSLLHCLRLSRSKVLIVDDDLEVLGRINEVRSKIEGELGMRIVVIDKETKSRIAAIEPKRPDDSVRAEVKGSDPAMLIYTRYV